MVGVFFFGLWCWFFVCWGFFEHSMRGKCWLRLYLIVEVKFTERSFIPFVLARFQVSN